ncbi:MAG: phosphonate metabolism protein PhnP [Gammaproteobacteria bacterium HGW-Gammaproteobacteria-6]|nr:MAG: phosphonate metabolism protein PhnP [Gammaproteobacteria bacterium HGW-Gammaproteobacteria-6]
MRVTFLGTGGAGGVPRFGCHCPACQRAHCHPEHVRRPCSALVQDGRHTILLDAGLMDLHERFTPGELSAIVLTHYHPDHVQGLLHLRWGKAEPIPVYGPPDPDGFADLFKHPGMLAISDLRPFNTLQLGDFSLTPLPLNHSKVTLGYAIAHRNGARFAYLTDTLGLSQETDQFLRTWRPDHLAVDCSHPPARVSGKAPQNHNDVTEALAIIRRSGAKQGWLTHLGHEADCWLMQQGHTLPENVTPAMDGQALDLTNRHGAT